MTLRSQLQQTRVLQGTILLEGGVTNWGRAVTAVLALKTPWTVTYKDKGQVAKARKDEKYITGRYN